MTRWPPIVAVLAALCLAACVSAPERRDASSATQCLQRGVCLASDSGSRWVMANEAARTARGARSRREAATQWLACSLHAYPAWHAESAEREREAAALATRCTRALLALEAPTLTRHWDEGRVALAGQPAMLSWRGWVPSPAQPARMALASTVSVELYGGKRHARDGFGAPLALLWPRCDEAEDCPLYPPEGVFREGTAWIEPGDDGPTLVIANPRVLDALSVGGQPFPLARDTSAPYALGVAHSKLPRLAMLGLLGNREVDRRSGVYLLEDYDPTKTPVVMIHGLGSSPLVWARLSNAIWGDPALSARYQVWHVVYQTNAPLLITRRRIEDYLDRAWQVLDPEGDDPSRQHVVLVGHSMGGVLARLLVADSGDTLWNAAFNVPVERLAGDPGDLATLQAIFRFQPYPGIRRVIFLAAPHRGSPAAGSWWGRLSRVLVGRRTPEMRVLQRVAAAQPGAVRDALRETYLEAKVNSISTLQTFQPVREAAEALLPAEGVRYHNLIANKPGTSPPSDGVVPVDSAELPGAESTTYLTGGHSMPLDDATVREVLRLLRNMDDSARAAPPSLQPAR